MAIAQEGGGIPALISDSIFGMSAEIRTAIYSNSPNSVSQSFTN